MKNIEVPIVHGEIQYTREDGLGVHEDFGFVAVNPDDKTRGMLHALLDEWLNKGGGTGYFFVGDLPTED